MRPVQRDEILDLGAYEQVRSHFRARVIEQKQHRRVHIGDVLTVLFENRDTVLLQIQEMLRTERITKEAGIAHEIETYNDLIPAADELSMTLFVEIPERDERERMLTALAGMESCVYIEVGGQRVAALAEERDGASSDRTTAVQYYKLPLGSELAAQLRAGAGVALGVEHEALKASAALSPATLAQLAADLEPE